MGRGPLLKSNKMPDAEPDFEVPVVAHESGVAQSTHEALMQSHIESIIKIAMDLGIYITVGSDFKDFTDLCRRTPGKAEVSVAFNPELSDISSHNGMWIAGHRANGEVVLTQAIRTIDLRQRTLGDYFANNLGDIRIGGMDVDVENTQWWLSDAAASISGLATYHGEVWLKGGPDGIRGGCLTTIMGRLILIMAALRWEPDYFIGLQPIKTACRGLGIRQGYARIEQRSVNWNIVGKDPIEGWLVWMNREDADYNLRIPPQTFYDLFETPVASNSKSTTKEVRSA